MEKVYKKIYFVVALLFFSIAGITFSHAYFSSSVKMTNNVFSAGTWSATVSATSTATATATVSATPSITTNSASAVINEF